MQSPSWGDGSIHGGGPTDEEVTEGSPGHEACGSWSNLEVREDGRPGRNDTSGSGFRTGQEFARRNSWKGISDEGKSVDEACRY